MPPKKRKGEDSVDIVSKKGRKKIDPENGASNADGDDEPQIKLEGSLISGEVLFCGGTNWDLIGRKQLPKGVKSISGPNLWGPHTLASLRGVKVRTVASGCSACHSVIITADGKPFTWGRNDQGQLGHGDCTRRDVPTLIDCMDDVNIVDAACGRNHTLLLSEYGKVYGFGDNKMAQLGLGNQTSNVTSPTRIVHKGPPVRKMACGSEFSAIVDVRGNLFTFGCPEYGQLGHNSDGKYFVTCTKMGYQCEMKPRRVQVFIEKERDGQVLPVQDVEIVDVTAGNNHMVALDRKKRVFTWGFGGYGRLGHAEQKDEMVPRLVKNFDGPNRGASMVIAGSAFTVATSETGMLYLWGQNKPTGEAAMYPKPVQDLCGWATRSIGCGNRSIVVAADESLVSWGPSPTYGELGYGANKPKSASQPQEVRTVDGIYIHKVACGYGHTLLIARSDTDEDKEKISKLPEFTP